MNENKNTLNNRGENERISLDMRQLIRFFIFSFITPAVVLIAGWDAQWLMGWILILMIGIPAVVSRLIIYQKNPDLLVERGQYREQQNNKNWDMLYSSIVGLFGPLLIWLISGLDHNFGWSSISPTIQWWAVVILFLCVVFSNWALITNRYFSAVVRIQTDRGHTVITDGPYKLVRHPGYAGGVIGDLAMPLMLGSLWALIPAVLTVIALVIRTAKEDQTLIDELPGYAEYTRQTKYRLIPGIW